MKRIMQTAKLGPALTLVLSVFLTVFVACTPTGPSPTPSPGNTGNLTVAVKASDGVALWGAKVVSSVQPEGQRMLNGLTTEPEGTVRFEEIRSGDYRFIVSRFDYEQQEVSARVVAGQNATVMVTMLRATPPPSPVAHSLYELEYILLGRYPDFFWCDPDYYPVGREGQEEKNAVEQFASIRANTGEFSAILKQADLPDKAEYTEAEKLVIYREHKKLVYGAQMTASQGGYDFVLRVGEGQGSRIEGRISPSGSITVLKQEPSFNTCPICLARGTLIDTPEGPVPVEQLSRGMPVWTVDESGQTVAAIVLETVTTPVPPSFRVVRVVLRDGRTVTASPGHPSAEGRPLGEYRVDDALDGSVVASIEYIRYEEPATYDILPSGGTGLYRANGILLKSTLHPAG